MRVVRRQYASPTGALLTVLNLVFGFIEFFIGLRILLQLLGANRSAAFVQFVYSISAPFVAPFSGIFPNQVLSEVFFLDAAAILAFVVYGLIMMVINSAFRRYSYGTTEEHDDL